MAKCEDECLATGTQHIRSGIRHLDINVVEAQLSCPPLVENAIHYDDAITRLRANIPEFNVLVVSPENLDDLQVVIERNNEFIDALIANNTVTVLLADNGSIDGDDNAERFSREFLSGNTKLERLAIGATSIRTKGAVALFRALGESNLKEFRTSFLRIFHLSAAEALRYALQTNHTLKVLDFRHMMMYGNIPEKDVEKVAKFIAEGIGATSINVLRFAACALTKTQAAIITSACNSIIGSLEILDLIGTSIYAQGAKNIAKLLIDPNNKLRGLKVSRCYLGAERYGAANNVHLDDSGLLALANSLMHNRTLMVLYINRNELSQGAAAAFVRALEKNTTLCVFEFDEKYFDPTQLVLINEYLDRNRAINEAKLHLSVVKDFRSREPADEEEDIDQDTLHENIVEHLSKAIEIAQRYDTPATHLILAEAYLCEVARYHVKEIVSLLFQIPSSAYEFNTARQLYTELASQLPLNILSGHLATQSRESGWYDVVCICLGNNLMPIHTDDENPLEKKERRIDMFAYFSAVRDSSLLNIPLIPLFAELMEQKFAQCSLAELFKTYPEKYLVALRAICKRQSELNIQTRPDRTLWHKCNDKQIQ